MAAADSSMDRLVVAISTDLIDDQPSSDPRWYASLTNTAVVSFDFQVNLGFSFYTGWKPSQLPRLLPLPRPLST